MIFVEYPDLDEFVLASVKKIMPFGAICSLDEYGGVEAFVHISEVSSGWVRNIREHLKEGQKIVAKVTFFDRSKNQIDLSVKRVSEMDRKRKLLAYQSEKRAQKLLERTARQLGKPLKQLESEAATPLVEEFGSLYSVFEALSKDVEPTAKVPKVFLDALTQVAKQEIKQKKVKLRAVLSLKSFAGDGLQKIKTCLNELSSLNKTKTISFNVHYVSAPEYFFDVEANDAKEAEKFLQKAGEKLAAVAKKEEVIYSMARA